MKTSTLNSLNTLVQTLNDGIEFYIAASSKVEHEHFKVVFAEMVEVRKFALAYLQPYVIIQDGIPELGHTFGGILHSAYTRILDAGRLDHDRELMNQLAVAENETLKAMHEAAHTTHNIMVLSVIKQLLPRMEAARKKVLQLQESLAA